MQALLEFITTDSLPQNNRHAVAIILKNILKKVYGVSENENINFRAFAINFILVDFA